MANKKYAVDIDLMKNQLLNAVIQVLSTAPSTPVAGQIYYSSTDTTFYGYNGTTWLNLGSLGAGSTDLSFSRDGTTVTVISNTGNDAILPAATTSLAGVMSGADKTKLDAITGTNTGDQTTIVGITGTKAQFDTAVTDGNFLYVGDVTSNATHTGEVTGDTALTIANDAVTNAKLANVATGTIKGRVTAATGDPEDLTATQVRTLLNVEDGADVTDATNVNAAGATMNADTTLVGNAWFLDDDTMAANDATKTVSQQSLVAYVTSQIGAVAGGITSIEEYNASTNTPDLDTSPSGIGKGDLYVVTVTGTFFAEEVQAGDILISKQNNPTLLTHWIRVNRNIPEIISASETAEGIIELATQSEVNTGTDTTRAVTPATLQSKLGITGTLNNALRFTTTIGDNSATSIAVTHNIGRQFVTAQVFQTDSPFAQIECEVRATSTTQTTFIFNTAPTSNQYTVVITG